MADVEHYQEREAFWRNKMEVERLSPYRLWLSAHTLLGRVHPPPSDLVTAKQFHRIFGENIAEVL